MSGVGLNTGAVAGGFMQGFLAAQNLRIRKQWYQYLMDRKPPTPPVNGAAEALANGRASYDKRQLDAQAGPTGAGPARNASMSPDGIATGKLVQAELIKRGVDPAVAAGAVGSMMGESGSRLNPGSINPKDGADGSDSVGIANWNGPRAQGLYKFANQTDIAKIPPATQAAFVGSELDNTDFGKSTLASLKAAKPGDVAAGTDIWTRKYEIPKDPDAAVAARVPYGQQFFQAANADASGTAKVPTWDDVQKDNAAGTASIAARSAAPPTPPASYVRPEPQTPTGIPMQPSQDMTTGPASVPLPPVRPVTFDSNPPPVQAVPVQALPVNVPADQAGDYPVAAAMGGPIGGVMMRDPGQAGLAPNPQSSGPVGGTIMQDPGPTRLPPIAAPSPIGNMAPTPRPAQRPFNLDMMQPAGGGYYHPPGETMWQQMARRAQMPWTGTGYGGGSPSAGGGAGTSSGVGTSGSASGGSASFAKGGVVKRYDMGGLAEDDGQDDLYTSQRELAMTDQADQSASPYTAGLPPPNGDPSLEGPAPLPVSGDASQGVDVASNTSIHLPHIPGGIPRLPSGAGAMPRVPSDRAPPAQKGPLIPDIAPDGSVDVTPQITNENGDLASGAASAIQGGLSFIARGLRGSTGGAIPDSAGAGNALKSFHDGEGALTEGEHTALTKKVDPDGSLDDDMRNIAGLEAVHKYYLAHNDPVSADRAAASMLMYSREAASKHADQAIKLFYGGKSEEGLKALVKAYNATPDGMTATAQENKDGSTTVAQLNMQGKVIWQEKVGPQQIMSAALGMKDGTMYWKLLSEAAGKGDPQGQAQGQVQVDPDKLFAGKGAMPAPGAGAPSAQPGASPAPQAIPNAPTSVSNPPIQNTAIPASPEVGATPPAPTAVAAQPPYPPQQTAIPASPTPDAQAAASPTLPPTVIPERTQEYQMRAEALKQQYLGPAAASDPINKVDQRYLNSLPKVQQAQAMAQIKQLRDQWKKEVWDPAVNVYNGALKDAAAGIRSDQSAAAADKRAQVNSDRDADRNELAKNRDAQRALRDKPITTADTEPATNALYAAFSPGVPDPKGASFGKLFDAPTATALRDTVVDISRWNAVASDTAANSVEAMIRPRGGMDDLPFTARPMKNADDMVKVTFKGKSLMPSVAMPKERLMALMSIRANLLAQVEGNAEDARRRGVVDSRLKVGLKKDLDQEPERYRAQSAPGAVLGTPATGTGILDEGDLVIPAAPKSAIPATPESSIWENLKDAIGRGAIGGNDAARLGAGG